ncbi:MAG: hypothetical protein IKX14_00315 [Neisseriaceae bacterium]|nr:hypothetical protein [Neisseriaceae bacterium]
MNFNDFYSALSGGLVGKDAHPTAFLFQKLGFAGVSFRLPENLIFNRNF